MTLNNKKISSKHNVTQLYNFTTLTATVQRLNQLHQLAYMLINSTIQWLFHYSVLQVWWTVYQILHNLTIFQLYRLSINSIWRYLKLAIKSWWHVLEFT